jgi:hypothetical protein
VNSHSTPEECELIKLFSLMTPEDRATLLDFARELPDEGPGKAFYESGAHPDLLQAVPWESLTDESRQFYRKCAREKAKVPKT